LAIDSTPNSTRKVITASLTNIPILAEDSTIDTQIVSNQLEQLFTCFKVPKDGFGVFGRSKDNLVFGAEEWSGHVIFMRGQRHALAAILHAPHNHSVVAGGGEDVLRVVTQGWFVEWSFGYFKAVHLLSCLHAPDDGCVIVRGGHNLIDVLAEGDLGD